MVCVGFFGALKIAVYPSENDDMEKQSWVYKLKERKRREIEKRGRRTVRSCTRFVNSSAIRRYNLNV